MLMLGMVKFNLLYLFIQSLFVQIRRLVLLSDTLCWNGTQHNSCFSGHQKEWDGPGMA